MAWIRQLPSGLWAATIYTGKTATDRITETHRLKGVVVSWASDQESKIRSGDWIDPRDGQRTCSELWDLYRESVYKEKASLARDLSHWRTHVAPEWAGRPIGPITKPDISAWVVRMQKAGVKPTTIEPALGVLRGLLECAVDAGYLRSNPARRISRPPAAKHPERVFTPDEEQELLDRLEELFPGQPRARLFVATMFATGMRWEEAAALRRDSVDLRRGLVHVFRVMERDGTVREYPKSTAGYRLVPVDESVWPELRTRVMSVPAGELIFPAPEGGSLLYPTWRHRVWVPALTRAEPDEEKRKEWEARKAGPAGNRPRGPAPKFVRLVPYLADPQPTPHDCRHTWGTRLGDAGVPVHDLAKLLGHEKITTSQRYMHSGDDRFDRARAALKSARSSVSRW